MGTISLRLDERDHELIKRYAAINMEAGLINCTRPLQGSLDYNF